jgi:hypothetical protein
LVRLLQQRGAQIEGELVAMEKMNRATAMATLEQLLAASDRLEDEIHAALNPESAGRRSVHLNGALCSPLPRPLTRCGLLSPVASKGKGGNPLRNWWVPALLRLDRHHPAMRALEDHVESCKYVHETGSWADFAQPQATPNPLILSLHFLCRAGTRTRASRSARPPTAWSSWSSRCRFVSRLFRGSGALTAPLHCIRGVTGIRRARKRA